MRGHLNTDVQAGLELGTLCSREQRLNGSPKLHILFSFAPHSVVISGAATVVALVAFAMIIFTFLSARFVACIYPNYWINSNGAPIWRVRLSRSFDRLGHTNTHRTISHLDDVRILPGEVNAGFSPLANHSSYNSGTFSCHLNESYTKRRRTFSDYLIQIAPREFVIYSAI